MRRSPRWYPLACLLAGAVAGLHSCTNPDDDSPSSSGGSGLLPSPILARISQDPGWALLNTHAVVERRIQFDPPMDSPVAILLEEDLVIAQGMTAGVWRLSSGQREQVLTPDGYQVQSIQRLAGTQRFIIASKNPALIAGASSSTSSSSSSAGGPTSSSSSSSTSSSSSSSGGAEVAYHMLSVFEIVDGSVQTVAHWPVPLPNEYLSFGAVGPDDVVIRRVPNQEQTGLQLWLLDLRDGGLSLIHELPAGGFVPSMAVHLPTRRLALDVANSQDVERVKHLTVVNMDTGEVSEDRAGWELAGSGTVTDAMTPVWFILDENDAVRPWEPWNAAEPAGPLVNGRAGTRVGARGDHVIVSWTQDAPTGTEVWRWSDRQRLLLIHSPSTGFTAVDYVLRLSRDGTRALVKQDRFSGDVGLPSVYRVVSPDGEVTRVENVWPSHAPGPIFMGYAQLPTVESPNVTQSIFSFDEETGQLNRVRDVAAEEGLQQLVLPGWVY
ncbi:MAG: hypothetical protein AB2A00_10970 [Myxococcota bacterium]